MIFLHKQKLEGFYQQQNCPETNVKRSSSGKKNKITWIRNSDLHKEMENIRKGINEGKTEYCIFLFRILKQHREYFIIRHKPLPYLICIYFLPVCGLFYFTFLVFTFWWANILCFNKIYRYFNRKIYNW